MKKFLLELLMVARATIFLIGVTAMAGLVFGILFAVAHSSFILGTLIVPTK